MWRRTPAKKASARADRPEPVPASRVSGRPSSLHRLRWMWTTFPTPSAAVLGAKLARHPRDRAVSRTHSRLTTARYAAVTGSAGPAVNSTYTRPQYAITTPPPPPPPPPPDPPP